MGVAYVTFALDHPSHFSVMFQPQLLRAVDSELIRAQGRSRGVLANGAEQPVEEAGGEASADAPLAAWSLVHGFATLVLSGAIDVPDPISRARISASHFATGPERRRL